MSATPTNPLLEPSPRPFQIPPFDQITDAHYREGFEKGMEEQARAVAAIAEQTAEPDFDNTVVALEKALHTGILSRTQFAFYTVNAADTNPDRETVEADFSPRLAAHNDAIFLDGRLYDRIEKLWQNRDSHNYDEQELYLLERYRTRFRRAGAALDEADRAELKEINGRLAELHAGFSRQVRTDINDAAVVVSDPAELEGLSEAGIAAARAAAKERGEDGYLIGMQMYSATPALEELGHRDVRRRVWESSVNRGKANAEAILEIVRLRARVARLMGYDDYADFVADDATAGSGSAVWDRLTAMVPAAMRNARAEADRLQQAIQDSGEDFTLQAWDWKYYAQQVKAAEYGFDPDDLTPYLELDTVIRDGVFYAAEKEYGLAFHERPDLVAYHDDVRIWEVRDSDGSVLGLFCADYFTRDSKRGGAWMNPLVKQSDLTGDTPVIMNNLNIVKPAEGQPALVTPDNVRTLFHEFGHALHGLFSRCRFPQTSGTSVPRDFVEYPSQVNEMWIHWPEVRANYVKHHRTGQAADTDLLNKWKASTEFGHGFAKVEYLAAALLDQVWHRLTPEEVPQAEGRDAAEVVEEFEKRALRDIGLDMEEIAPRYRSGYFAHTFTGGYAAGYYSYIWSEILDADTVEWFKDNGGLNRANGDRFRAELLSKGGSVPPLESYVKFRGRPAELEPLLRRHGLD
ncbi:M3 family metallopeptidase [Haloglycomyces albus]|uniref:M3 family metallopeptidase n=1 Tax=Haloglycomyces albus TaxID=526067 RepID=UPI00046D91F0|nr:M3 family metallopeptidase [Haloglycomyces albus]